MNIIIIGGAGAMARLTAKDLIENKDIDKLIIADYNEAAAKNFAAELNDDRVKGILLDARNIEEMASIFKNVDTVINSTTADLNVNVMKACLKSGSHYNDLGGLFHYTRKQLQMFDDYKKAGLTAILGIGAGPGITNVMARYAYDRLDRLNSVRLYGVSVFENEEMKHSEFEFHPPYSVRAIMDEYSEENVQYIDGEYKTFPPLSGEIEVIFPEPVGKKKSFYTLHSEPATIPESFKDKGVKEVTWRLGLPDQFDRKARIFASIGMGGKDPIDVNGMRVSPIDFFSAIVEKNKHDYEQNDKKAPVRTGIMRAEVNGEKDGKMVDYIVDCFNRPHSKWKALCATSIPPSIVAQMQAKGEISDPGVWGPEQIINPVHFFTELKKREFEIEVSVIETF